MAGIAKIIEQFVRCYIEPFTVEPPPGHPFDKIVWEGKPILDELKGMSEEEKTLATLILDRHVAETEKEAEKRIRAACDARDAYLWWLERAGN